MNTNWEKANEVVCEQLGHGALLVELKSGKRWLLNASAAALWKLNHSAISFNDFCSQLKSLPMCQFAGDMPTVNELGLGVGPRRRPSPRGNSGPG